MTATQAREQASLPAGRIARALQAFRRALGDDAVLDGHAAMKRYGADTSALSRRIPAALLPENVEEVQALVRIAQEHGVPLYPISTGHSWGYGTANPVVDDCVIVDLSGMRRIIALDEELGLVTVEPGVTQGDLRRALDERALPFMVPVTGAGPTCSLLGNALERGYGPSPYADHFMAVLGLEAVLPSGELYRSALVDCGGAHTEAVFKWGVGPYLDGLFSQGNFGIVTQMTLALARRPERVSAFFLEVERDEQLEAIVSAVREILRLAQANVGTVTLLSQMRMLAMMGVDYPRSRVPADAALSPELIAELSEQARASAWAGAVPMYGTAAHVAATRELVERLVRPHVWRLTFVDSAPTVDGAPSPLGLSEGRPSELSLQLAYWRSGRRDPGKRADPARDGCGLVWYSPVVPMRPETVRRSVELMRRECKRHGLEAPITFVSLSERAFDSPLPLLFDRDDPNACARADACYRALFEAGRAEGLVPYRMGAQFMPLLVDADKTSWRMASNLQRAIDPAGILAPGRYSLRRG